MPDKGKESLDQRGLSHPPSPGCPSRRQSGQGGGLSRLRPPGGPRAPHSAISLKRGAISCAQGLLITDTSPATAPKQWWIAAGLRDFEVRRAYPSFMYRLSRTLLRWLAAGLAAVVVLSFSGGASTASHTYVGIVPTDTYNSYPTLHLCANASGPTDPAGVVCQSDNSSWYWYADSADPGELEADDKASVQNVLSSQYSPTDISVHYESSPVFSGSGETDLILEEADAGKPLPNGYYGITWCDDAVNGTSWNCDQTYVRISNPWYRSYSGSVACHEMGHGLGLVHGNNASPMLDPGDARLGCMVNEEEFPSNLGSASAHLIDITY